MNDSSIVPRASVVVVPRDHFSSTARSLRSLVETIDDRHEIVYVAAGLPRGVRKEVARLAESRPMRIVRRRGYLSPTAARNLGAAYVSPESDLLAFVDSDVVFREGWLESLLACATREAQTWSLR